MVLVFKFWFSQFQAIQPSNLFNIARVSVSFCSVLLRFINEEVVPVMEA